MNVHVTAKNLTLSPAATRMLERRISKLRKRLSAFEPDLVQLDVAVERHARRPEFTGSLRLFVVNRTLTAARNSADTPMGLIQAAFEDLEEQLDRFKAELRRESARRRVASEPLSEATVPELPETQVASD
ncbi:MAG TPA: HPF/RaiA family ribosome-associated protein [Longimicrobiales bacterium]|nr:HPF/RaiA family ribosome-associated protein [Longimicrobiales bacterium]